MLDIYRRSGMKSDHAISGRQGILCHSRRTVDAKLVGYFSMVDAIILNKMRIFLMETQRHI